MTLDSTMATTDGASAGVPTELAERLDRWHRAVAGVLAKSRRVAVSELGDDVWQELRAHTYDGVAINPLYTRADEHPARPAPGTYPFVRGISATAVGWHVNAAYGNEGEADVSAVNTALLAGLESGVSAPWLAIGADHESVVGPDDLREALAGVLLDLAPLTLRAGSAAPAAAAALTKLLDERADAGAGVPDRADVIVQLGVAPLTEDGVDLPAAVELAGRMASRPETIRTFVADGTVFHDNGATDSDEVALAVAVALTYVRALVDAGMDVTAAFGQVGFRLAATDDQFLTIAKFRAAREVWARIAEQSGVPEAGAAPQHAVTSSAMMSQRDPWVNMLRTTLAAFGAGVGGATEVTVQPFDAAIPGGAPGTSRSFAARIARNTQLLLLEESNIGFVTDPAGGSWYVEDLTVRLADVIWARFRELEQAGGYEQAHAEGRIDALLTATWELRRADISHRRVAVTGINEFPNLAERALPPEVDDPGDVRRYGADFERLRARSDRFLAETGARPQVALLPLGPVAEHNGRTTFTANLLASGGIETLNPGPLTPGGDEWKAAVAAAPTIVVVCGTDKRYADEGSTAVTAARSAGATRVLVAGGPTAFADGDAAGARPDGFLTMGMDGIAMLTDLLATLGVK